ncbi:MAG: hypothetical protein NT030_05410 [Candidatus Saganbacteria bacterium]|nr:hypothetical protein [Candidatus Saganbacteria bacterium]
MVGVPDQVLQVLQSQKIGNGITSPARISQKPASQIDKLLSTLGLKSLDEAFVYLAKLRIDGNILVSDQDIVDPVRKKTAVIQGLQKYGIKGEKQILHLASLLKKWRLEGKIKENIEGKIDISSEDLKDLLSIIEKMADPAKLKEPALAQILNPTDYSKGAKAPEVKIEQIKTNLEIPKNEAPTFTYPQGTLQAAAKLILRVTGKNGPYPEPDAGQTKKELELLGVG